MADETPEDPQDILRQFHGADDMAAVDAYFKSVIERGDPNEIQQVYEALREIVPMARRVLLDHGVPLDVVEGVIEGRNTMEVDGEEVIVVMPDGVWRG